MAKEFSEMILPKLIDEIMVKERFNDVTQTINTLDQNNNNSSPQVVKTTFLKYIVTMESVIQLRLMM